jgi:hypothetical protein
MKIKNLWKVDRHGDQKKFEVAQQTIYKELNNKTVSERPLFQPSERPDVDIKNREIYKATNTALLFHGTASSSVSGILRENFRQPKDLPKAVFTGNMFSGMGANYQADDWKKSAGYTSLRNSYYANGKGLIAGRAAFMFACDVVLGEPHVAPGPHPFSKPPNGTHCVFGMGRSHGKRINSGVENNEWVIFDIPQIKIKYLLEFSV